MTVDTSGEMVPVRVNVDICCAVTRASYENGDFWDEITGAVEALPGFFCDGGDGGLMKRDEARGRLELFLREPGS
jgi:hypothetical protein